MGGNATGKQITAYRKLEMGAFLQRESKSSCIEV